MRSHHEHVRIAVVDADPPGVEYVPAQWLGKNQWELIRSPLYATEVASGDIVRIIDEATGRFEIVKRGGNLCVHFYLREADADDPDATAKTAEIIRSKIAALGGRIDGTVPGLISCTVGVDAGFPAIEAIFKEVAEKCPGAQWQFANVYDPISGEPLGWWKEVGVRPGK